MFSRYSTFGSSIILEVYMFAECVILQSGGGEAISFS